MTDMTAFERQLSGEITGLMGPIRPVDDAAIFTAITTTQSPRWKFGSMFSATMFVVAGAIVALFGGFLLAGVLTQPREDSVPAAVTGSPDPVAELLPGVDFVTEEIEPGVYRVLSDGVRDLSRSNDRLGGGPDLLRLMDSQVVVGLDGSVWIFEQDGFFRIGDEATHQWEDDDYPFGWFATSDAAVGPDGTLWRAGPLVSEDEEPHLGLAQLRSFDGREWVVHVPAIGRGGSEVDVTADGVVWVGWERGRECLGRLTDDSWEIIDAPGGCPVYDISAVGGLVMGDQGVRILDGGAWRTVPYPPGLETAGYATSDFGPDGTAWVQGGSTDWGSTLGRFDGTEWQVFDASEVPHWWEFKGTEPQVLGVAPDGSVWYPAGSTWAEGEDGCSVARFDGRTATKFLSGYCVTDLDITPDGAVWLRAVMMERSAGTDVVHTYVITPEAVAATE